MLDKYLHSIPCLQSGEVWPNGSVDVIVVFAPTRGEDYSNEAYCELTGRDERLVLEMLGKGKGPQMIINVNILDIDFIFLCSKHSYEVSGIKCVVFKL